MQIHNLSNNTKTVRASNAVAAGTTVINSAWIDTRGFSGIEFTAWFGALTANQVTSAKLQYSNDGATLLGDVAGSASAALADDDSNRGLQLELYRPKHRFVRMVISRGTANAVLDVIQAKLFNAHEVPVAKDSTMALTPKVLNAPTSGVA